MANNTSYNNNFTQHKAKSIGERVRIARKAQNLNQAELAARLGVTQPAVANWESGQHDPRRLVLAKLASVLDVSLDWLAAGARSPFEADKHPAAAYLRRPIVQVPVITFQNAALFLNNVSQDPHLYAEDYFPYTSGLQSMFGVVTSDDSMDAVLPEGVAVVIDYGDRRLVDGAYYLVMVGEAPLIRQCREDPDRVETRCLTREPDIILINKHQQIIGRVVASIRIF